MLKIVQLSAAVALVAIAAAPSATADQRFAHKNGNATAGTCGSSSDLSDTANGPCNTMALALSNAKAAGGGSNRIIVMGNGNFFENLLLDDTARPTEIRRTGDGNPGIGATGAAGTAITIAVGGQRVLIDGIRVNNGQGSGATTGIKVNSVGTLELSATEFRGFGGVAPPRGSWSARGPCRGG